MLHSLALTGRKPASFSVGGAVFGAWTGCAGSVYCFTVESGEMRNLRDIGEARSAGGGAALKPSTKTTLSSQLKSLESAAITVVNGAGLCPVD